MNKYEVYQLSTKPTTATTIKVGDIVTYHEAVAFIYTPEAQTYTESQYGGNIQDRYERLTELFNTACREETQGRLIRFKFTREGGFIIHRIPCEETILEPVVDAQGRRIVY
jgi:hypothetical protein